MSDGYNYTQIAKEMNVERQTIMTMVERAMDKMKRNFEKKTYEHLKLIKSKNIK